MSNDKTEIGVKEVENGWIVTIDEVAYVYHTWPEVVQSLSEFFDECDDSPAVGTPSTGTDPKRSNDAGQFYPWGRGF